MRIFGQNRCDDLIIRPCMNTIENPLTTDQIEGEDLCSGFCVNAAGIPNNRRHASAKD